MSTTEGTPESDFDVQQPTKKGHDTAIDGMYCSIPAGHSGKCEFKQPELVELADDSTPRLWPFETKPANIYIAASIYASGQAARLALILTELGMRVTSRWLRHHFRDRPARDNWNSFVQYEAKWGTIDTEDVVSCDTLVVLTEKPTSSGGLHYELGYFLGQGKTNVVVVGTRPNVFFFTEHVRFMPNDANLPEFLMSKLHGIQ